MKRIVEETLANGKTRYTVETNRFLGIFPCAWRIDKIFDNPQDAAAHLGMNWEGVLGNRVIARKVIF